MRQVLITTYLQEFNYQKGEDNFHYIAASTDKRDKIPQAGYVD